MFPSTADYLNSFMNPLIEKIRADFCSALENVAQAPVCEITQPTIRQFYPHKYGVSTKSIIHHNERNYRPKSGDIFLLTSSRLRDTEDLYEPGEAFLMAFVIGSQRNWNYTILTSKEIDSGFGPILPLITPKPKRHLATYMINLTTYMRIWWALKRCLYSSKSSLIQRVLQYDSSVRNLLNESQKSAILSSISMRNCSHDEGCSKVKLIWGPHGTGKTKTVASLLFALLKLNCRTLTCAPTNVAVVQVLKRLMDLVLRSHDKYGNCRLGDIVLLGNAERMNTNESDDLAKVYLNNRVPILYNSLREWRSCLASIKNILSNPERQDNERNLYSLA
ncbi:putative helicase senataxin [Bienertia sinuspersici]